LRGLLRHYFALPFFDFFDPFGLPLGFLCAAISIRTNSSSASGTCFNKSLGVQSSAVHIRDKTDRSMLPCSPLFCSIRKSVLYGMRVSRASAYIVTFRS
jgi:hypothetical protein